MRNVQDLNRPYCEAWVTRVFGSYLGKLECSLLWIASEEGPRRRDFRNGRGRYCTGVLNLPVMSTSGLSLTFALTLSLSLREKEHTQDLLGTQLLPLYLYCSIH